MAEFYTRFIRETFDENGRLTACSYVYDETFNYGYDVIDPLGTLYPDRRAMVWRNDRGERTVLTFGDVKRLSTQTANLFAARGLRKGDVVLFTLGDGRYVVHRVWKLTKDAVRTFGDNCRNPEPWFPQRQVLGLVVSFRRGKRVFRLDTPAARAWGRAWMAAFPVRECYIRLKGIARRCYRMVFPKTTQRR